LCYCKAARCYSISAVCQFHPILIFPPVKVVPSESKGSYIPFFSSFTHHRHCRTRMMNSCRGFIWLIILLLLSKIWLSAESTQTSFELQWSLLLPLRVRQQPLILKRSKEQWSHRFTRLPLERILSRWTRIKTWEGVKCWGFSQYCGSHLHRAYVKWAKQRKARLW